MTTTTTTYEPCGACGAPLDEQQRYCVECGTSRRHPGDPVARYFADAAARRRVPPPAAGPVVAAGGRHVENRWIAAALALIPVAAAIGVLVGHHGNGGTSDAQLLAALRGSGAAAGSAAPAGSPAAAAAIPSDFSLPKGYVVKLGTLPGRGTGAAAVARAKRAARSKGAPGVGVINPSDFVLRPASGSSYVLYSGQFKTRSEAVRALARLRRRFRKASVVAVSPAAVGGGPTAGKISTSASVATQEHPTAKQQADGARIVQQIQASKGKTYVQQQRKLPDTIVVP
jgi:hypothetical protein